MLSVSADETVSLWQSFNYIDSQPNQSNAQKKFVDWSYWSALTNQKVYSSDLWRKYRMEIKYGVPNDVTYLTNDQTKFVPLLINGNIALLDTEKGQTI